MLMFMGFKPEFFARLTKSASQIHDTKPEPTDLDKLLENANTVEEIEKIRHAVAGMTAEEVQKQDRSIAACQKALQDGLIVKGMNPSQILHNCPTIAGIVFPQLVDMDTVLGKLSILAKLKWMYSHAYGNETLPPDIILSGLVAAREIMEHESIAKSYMEVEGFRNMLAMRILDQSCKSLSVHIANQLIEEGA